MWLTCIGLLAILFASELLPAHPAARPLVSTRTPASPTRPDAHAPPRGQVPDAARIILARPLFTVGRRPAPDAARPGLAASSSLPRLSGIIIAAQYRRALFDREGKPLAGSMGDHVGPYAILAIAPAQVTVAGPAGVQVLTLRFGPPPPPPPPAPGILDRLRAQHYRPPPVPSSALLQQMLLRQPPHAAPD